LSDWNSTIIEEFRANEGRVGGRFEGEDILLLHHTGARSGIERVNPLVYVPDGDHMIIVASAAGAPKNPDWFYNLRAHPHTTVEVGTATVTVDTTEVTDEEYPELWKRVTTALPRFAEYQQNTTRRIPMMILQPTQ